MNTIFDKIRSGGYYVDDKENSTDNNVVVGGRTYVCDDLDYYITMKLLELTKFKSQTPQAKPANIKAFYKKVSSGIAGETRYKIYKSIMDKSKTKKLLHKQLNSLLSAVKKLEAFIVIRAITTAKTKGHIDTVLPPINEHIHDIIENKEIFYDPHALTVAINTIKKLIKKINILSIGGVPVNKDMEAELFILEEFTTNSPNMDDIAPSINAHPTEQDYYNMMDMLHDFEFNTVYYARAVEKYHCSLITKLVVMYFVVEMAYIRVP